VARLARVIVGLATVDRLHIEGMAEDEWDTLLGTGVGEPVPSAQVLDGDNQSIAMGRAAFEKGIRAGLQMAVHHNLARLIQDADVHGTGVQVKATRKWALRGIESHQVSASLGCYCWPSASRPRWYAEEGASISINGGRRRLPASARASLPLPAAAERPRLGHRRQAPRWGLGLACMVETRQAFGVFVNRTDVCVKANMLSRGGTDDDRAPSGPAHVAAIVAEHDGFQTARGGLQIAEGVFTCPDEITKSFICHPRDIDHSEITRAGQAGQWHGISAVGCDPIA
jgi:hypothetical protein